ncbi:hypothetical protein LCGC14_2900850 [marine sediment metagenome]|uniref:Uncharacterized protein n=1 Tax=marine sediment metagenome TaxID=412755 RepID=A0A0F8YGB7_9ZZZZ
MKQNNRLFAVEKHGAEKEVLRLYTEKVPATKISQILAERGIKIAPLGINRWLKNQKVRARSRMDIQAVERFENMVVNYKTEIIDILDEVKELKTYAKEDAKNGKWHGYDKLVGRLYQGIELLAKLMGDIKPAGNVDINIIINDLNKKAFDKNKKMRDNLYGKTVIDIDAEIENDVGTKT